MKFVKSALIVAACLLIAVCSSAAQNPVGVLVNTNGTLRFPTNLFAANSNLLNAAVAPSSGVGSATNALTTLNGLVGTNQTFSAGPAGNTDLAITSSGTNHAFNIAIRTNFAAITISNNVNRALLTPTGALIDVSCDGPSIIYHTLTQNTIFALIDPPASTAQERFIKVTVTGNGVNTVGFGFTGGTIVWMSTQLATPGNGSVVDYQFAIRGATAYASVCCPPINIEHVTGLQAALDDKQVEGDYITALTGDGTAIGPGSAAFTLANTAVTPGTFGSATKTVTATVDAKGRLTALSEQTATPAWASITSTPTTLGGYGITDAQPLDSDLTAIALLTTTAFGRGLLDDADATAGRVSLGVVIGTNVQAYDADLDDLADGSLTGSKVGTGINGDNVTSGTVSDARIASTIARDSEVAAAYQLAFTTGAGVTNIANVLSGNYTPGSNITLTTNANGAVAIAASASSAAPGSPLFSSTADASNNATASDVSIIGTGVGSKTTSASYFSAGTSLIMIHKGVLSTAITPDNLTLKIKAGSVVIATASGVALTGALSDSNWEILALITCRTTGASGTFKCNAIFASTGAALTPLEAKIVDSGNAVDTTGTIAWDVTATWASTTAGDIITGSNFIMFTPDSGNTVSDTAFASSWNGVTTTAPSKNAVYDWGHIFDTDDDGKVNVLDVGAGVVHTDSGGIASVSTVTISEGGTGQTTATAAFDALSPNTTRGDIAVRGASSNVRLAIGASGTFLTSNGTDPSWGTPSGYLITYNMAALGSPADSTSYYLGSDSIGSLQTVFTNGHIRILKAGTIKSSWVKSRQTAGTSEATTFSITLNGSTDISLGTADLSSTSAEVSATGLSQAVVAGDFIALKIATPAWATNPTSFRVRWDVYIE